MNVRVIVKKKEVPNRVKMVEAAVYSPWRA